MAEDIQLPSAAGTKAARTLNTACAYPLGVLKHSLTAGKSQEQVVSQPRGISVVFWFHAQSFSWQSAPGWVCCTQWEWGNYRRSRHRYLGIYKESSSIWSTTWVVLKVAVAPTGQKRMGFVSRAG